MAAPTLLMLNGSVKSTGASGVSGLPAMSPLGSICMAASKLWKKLLLVI